MRALIQRVKSAQVEIDNKVVGKIGVGILLFLGVTHNDEEKDVKYLVNKTLNLRIFSDENGKMNLSLLDVAGEILIVSQFTLYGDTSQGRRPYFGEAALPDKAEKLYERFIDEVKKSKIPVETGNFGADMLVELKNDGPVTIMLESI